MVCKEAKAFKLNTAKHCKHTGCPWKSPLEFDGDLKTSTSSIACTESMARVTPTVTGNWLTEETLKSAGAHRLVCKATKKHAECMHVSRTLRLHNVSEFRAEHARTSAHFSTLSTSPHLTPHRAAWLPGANPADARHQKSESLSEQPSRSVVQVGRGRPHARGSGSWGCTADNELVASRRLAHYPQDAGPEPSGGSQRVRLPVHAREAED